MKNGFFVEAGAVDFESETNSLYFEVIIFTVFLNLKSADCSAGLRVFTVK